MTTQTVQITCLPFKTSHDGADRLTNLISYAGGLLKRGRQGYRVWQERQTERRAQQAMFEFARDNPRLMTEIRAAASRQGVSLQF